MAAADFDVIVIGAGPAGETAAGVLAEGGRHVAIVEADLVGGECAYYACMPSKALLRPSAVLAEAARVPGAAQAVTGALDVEATLRRRDEVIHGLADTGQLPWLADRGITLLRGHARLDGERAVTVDGLRHAARDAVVVAVGSGAVVPDLPGLREAEPWTSREVTTAHEPPGSMIVLGGGPVGVEMAQAYRSFGVRVTLIEALERLLANEEPFAGAELAGALRDGGVDVRTQTRALSVSRAGRELAVALDDGDTVVAERILVAVGRRPHTDDLGLETVGLEPGQPIAVDDHMRVARQPWLYAVGDVNGRALLTHAGKRQARVAAHTIAGDEDVYDERALPRVVFTEPQVASVGMTLAAALERGLDARAYDTPTSAVAGASFVGRNAPGTSRIVVDEARGVLVGATFTGVDVAEWLHAATIAIVGAVPVERLWDAVPAFPTRSEVWLKLLVERDHSR